MCLVLREAVTNIVRHASASAASLRLEGSRHSIVLRLEDNGVGPAAKEGNGLRGMRERLGKLGGMVELTRLPTGAALTATLPTPEEPSVFDAKSPSSQDRLPTEWTVPV